MNISEVVSRFELEHKGKYSQGDHQLIISAIQSLGIDDFTIKYRSDVKTSDGHDYSVYFRDKNDFIHVHKTMIVARHEFDGYQPGLLSKYYMFPYMVELSNWVSKSNANRPSCPTCFLEIPLVGLCGQCGFDLDEICDE